MRLGGGCCFFLMVPSGGWREAFPSGAWERQGTGLGGAFFRTLRLLSGGDSGHFHLARLHSFRMFGFARARDENSGMTRFFFRGGFWVCRRGGGAKQRLARRIPKRRLGTTPLGAKQSFAPTHSQAELGNDRVRVPSGAWRDAFPSGAWERHG